MRNNFQPRTHAHIYNSLNKQSTIGQSNRQLKVDVTDAAPQLVEVVCLASSK